jgi:leader peptidase (prepilin peptidase)/N-methyltransferase
MNNWLSPPLFSGVLFVTALAAASLTGALLLNGMDAVFGALLAALALYVAIVDLNRFEIPDLGSLAILFLGLAWSLESYGIDFDVFAEIGTRALLAAGILFGLRSIYRMIRNIEGLGLGDVKLVGAGASWLSWSHLALALLIAAVAAILLVILQSALARERIQPRTAVPFGAFLAPAIWAAWVTQAGAFLPLM